MQWNVSLLHFITFNAILHVAKLYTKTMAMTTDSTRHNLLKFIKVIIIGVPLQKNGESKQNCDSIFLH